MSLRKDALRKGLIKLRKERGIKQEDIRHDLNINIGRVESPKYNMSFTTFYKLLDYYEISTPDFYMKYVEE